MAAGHCASTTIQATAAPAALLLQTTARQPALLLWKEVVVVVVVKKEGRALTSTFVIVWSRDRDYLNKEQGLPNIDSVK